MNPSELELRAKKYARARGLAFASKAQLGFGTDGTVWKTKHKTAIKVFERQRNYNIELGCYLRFRELAVKDIDGFAVPNLVDFDDALQIIEIAIVSPPYLLDFGKASLDTPPDYPEEILAEELQRHSELWDDRWPIVQELLWSLQSMGIYYLDPKPGNIRFADELLDDNPST